MKKKNIIFYILVFILFIIIIISLFNIYKWNISNIKTKTIKEKIDENTNLTEKTDNEDTIVIPPSEDTKEDSLYFSFIKYNLIDVDFTKLKEMNNDVIGWIEVKGTNINYPFVKTNDNEFYLNHSFDKTYNDAGWVFMDYRNDLSNNKNTIIYAHSRIDMSLFATLRNVFKSSWLSDSSNYVIRTSTLTENSLWQIFSVYHLPTTTDYLKVNFYSDEEYSDFLNMISNRSFTDFNTSVSVNDEILTLSSCFDAYDEKMVVHAKLIKREKK